MAIKDIVIGGKNVKEIRINGGLYFKKQTGKVIYKIEIDYDSANMLNPANFTLNGVTESGGVYTFPGGDGLSMITQPMRGPGSLEKFYGSVDMKVPPNTNFADGRFEYYASDDPGNLLVFTSFFNAIQDNEWHKYSDIGKPSVYSGNWTLRSFAVNPSNTVYRRNHYIMKIDRILESGLQSIITKDILDNDLAKPVSQRGIMLETNDFIVLQTGSGLPSPTGDRILSVDNYGIEVLTYQAIIGNVGICNLDGINTIKRLSIYYTNKGQIYLNDVTTIEESAIGFFNSTAAIHFGNKINNIKGIVFYKKDYSSNISNPIYLHYAENDEVNFDPSLFVYKGHSDSSKSYTYTYNFYTDNSIIRNGLLSQADIATTVNVYHLDGSNW